MAEGKAELSPLLIATLLTDIYRRGGCLAAASRVVIIQPVVGPRLVCRCHSW